MLAEKLDCGEVMGTLEFRKNISDDYLQFLCSNSLKPHNHDGSRFIFLATQAPLYDLTFLELKFYD